MNSELENFGTLKESSVRVWKGPSEKDMWGQYQRCCICGYVGGAAANAVGTLAFFAEGFWSPNAYKVARYWRHRVIECWTDYQPSKSIVTGREVDPNSGNARMGVMIAKGAWAWGFVKGVFLCQGTQQANQAYEECLKWWHGI